MEHKSSARCRHPFVGLVLYISLLVGTAASEEGPEKPDKDDSYFIPVDEPYPTMDVWTPPVPRKPPEGSDGLAYDNFDNYWTFSPVDAKGKRTVMALPAQDRSAWIDLETAALKRAAWQWIQPDEHGYLWVASSLDILRFDPRHPERGWQNVSSDSGFPSGRVTAISVGPRGSMMAALDRGTLVEMDRDVVSTDPIREHNRIRTAACPSGVDRLLTDDRGRIWLDVGGKTFRSLRPVFDVSGSLQSTKRETIEDEQNAYWKLIARMPGCNHDLSGDVLNGRFYVGGGLTNGWGYPAKDHDFSKLFEFDARRSSWRIAAELGRGRVYCTTSHLDGKVWIIGGDVFEPDGSRRAMNWVQIVDPETGKVADGPPTSVARPMPLAVHVNGRIYVAGNPRGEYDRPGRIESIGSGDREWRPEPDGPAGFGPLAGCALGDRFYLAVPEQFLSVFDTSSRTWSTVEVPHPPRSCQMAAYRGEIWLMGGRGTPGESKTQIYDPRTEQWRTGPPLPRELSWGAAAAIGGKLVVTGGAGKHGLDWSYNNRTWVLRDPAGTDSTPAN